MWIEETVFPLLQTWALFMKRQTLINIEECWPILKCCYKFSLTARCLFLNKYVVITLPQHSWHMENLRSSGGLLWDYQVSRAVQQNTDMSSPVTYTTEHFIFHRNERTERLSFLKTCITSIRLCKWGMMHTSPPLIENVETTFLAFLLASSKEHSPTL